LLDALPTSPLVGSGLSITLFTMLEKIFLTIRASFGDCVASDELSVIEKLERERAFTERVNNQTLKRTMRRLAEMQKGGNK